MDYNEVIKFMKEFEIDVFNRFDELIIDVQNNIYTIISDCKDIDDIKTRVVFSLCRPIGKGLNDKHANRLLKKFNRYFETNLSRKDLLLMYSELCYSSKLEEFKDFIKRGFPIDELKEAC